MTLSKEFDSIDIVSRAVDRISRRGRFAEFELSNGIVLSLKPVPPLLLQAINQEFVVPLPPMWLDPEKGREEPNPNDPAYIKSLEELGKEQDLALNNCVLGIGTSAKSVPEGYFMPENDGWIAHVEFAASLSGKKIDIEKDDSVRRYLCWLRFYALETSMDVVLATGLVSQLGGIREEEVEEVVDSFRSLSERGADTESTVETGSQNGNTANRASRRASPRDRRT